MTDTITFSDPVLLTRLDALMDRLDAMAEHLARVDALLTEFEPVIRAVLDPAASGPLAWAVRRKVRP